MLTSGEYENSSIKDHQALLKAKYCPRVAAQHHSHRKKTTKNSCGLDILTYELEIQ